jgi:hypothetical protein
VASGKWQVTRRVKVRYIRLKNEKTTASCLHFLTFAMLCGASDLIWPW